MTPSEIQGALERFLLDQLGNEDPQVVGVCMVAYAVDFMALQLGRRASIATVGVYADHLKAAYAGEELADKLLAQTLSARH